jgi:hypothetical protein
VRVYTSARVLGRAQAGLSHRLAQLEQLGKTHQPMLVESAFVLENRFRLRRQLRQVWQETKAGEKLQPSILTSLAKKLAIDPHWLGDTILFAPTFGLLVQQIGRQQPLTIADDLSSDRMVDIKSAIAELRSLLNQPLSLEQIEPILLLPQPF